MIIYNVWFMKCLIFICYCINHIYCNNLKNKYDVLNEKTNKQKPKTKNQKKKQLIIINVLIFGIFVVKTSIEKGLKCIKIPDIISNEMNKHRKTKRLNNTEKLIKTTY